MTPQGVSKGLSSGKTKVRGQSRNLKHLLVVIFSGRMESVGLDLD